MHRSWVAVFCFVAMAIAACGGRIQQGKHQSPPKDPTPAVMGCGYENCSANEECCVGGAPSGNEDDPTASLESCVPSGTCDTGLLFDCFGSCGNGKGGINGSVCCLTINPTTSFATAGCAQGCGGNGLGDRVCVDGRCEAPAESTSDENAARRPPKVKKKFVRPALFVAGVTVAALAPIAAIIALFAAEEKNQCENEATAPSLVFGTPVDDAHCSNYNATITVGALAAVALGISGTIMIIAGAKRVPIDAPDDAKIRVVPWSERNGGGAALQLRF